MKYSTEHLRQSLKEARKAQEMSQRELSERSGLPQSHISNIENANLDPRISNFVNLAIALNLELMLVPKSKVSAVRAITGDFDRQVVHKMAVQKELKHLRGQIAQLTKKIPSNISLAQISRQVREFEYFELTNSDLEVLRSVKNKLNAFQNTDYDESYLLDILSTIEQLRFSLAMRAAESTITDFEEPAYSLDEYDNG